MKNKVYIITSLFIIMLTIMSFMSYNKAKYINKPVTEFGVISSTRFSEWIGGAPNAIDVFVKPANSVEFVGENIDSLSLFDRQDFFRWSQQMFLWVLSPVPDNGSYGNCGGLVLNSPEFFDFDTENLNYVRHKCNGVNKMSFDVMGAQNGIHNLPLFIDKNGNVYDVDKTPKSELGYPLIFDVNKNKVEVDKVVVKETKVVFYDRNGKVIEKPKLILSPLLNPRSTIQQFNSSNGLVFILIIDDLAPIILNSTIQQASLSGDTSNVLMNQYGSLVYYNIMVNDVYVAFSKMIDDGIVPDTALFPTTLTELQDIKAYGTANGIPIVDTEDRVLAMELKTSWVETTNLPNSDTYVKVKATIPNYVSMTNGTWVKQGTRVTELALVGMHVVGSVAGHPEMIWSTFEHVKNAPNSAIDALQNPPSPSTGFIFNNGTISNANIPHISGRDTLVAIPPYSFSEPTNVVRRQAFGWSGILGVAGGNGRFNSIDVLDNQTSDNQLTALYSDVRTRLLPGDVRRNYFQVGAMWNSPFNNLNPNSPKYNTIDNHIAGTVRLSNSTMETFTQANSSSINSSPTDAGLNCFSCHDRGVDNNGVYSSPAPSLIRLSHVFGKPIAP